MERFFPRVDQWLFDYLVYKYITFYSMEESEEDRNRSQLMSPLMKELLHETLEKVPPSQSMAHLLMLVFSAQEIELISSSYRGLDGMTEIPIQNLPCDQYKSIHGHLTDVQDSLKIFSHISERDSIKELCRKCLVDTLVMKFQLNLVIGHGEQEILDTLKKLDDGDNSAETKAAYKFCSDLKPISGKMRPFSEFITGIKELTSAIISCIEIPQLVQFAMNDMEDRNVQMSHLLQDQRPSRKEDVTAYFTDGDLTDGRKEELDQLVHNTNHSHQFPLPLPESLPCPPSPQPGPSKPKPKVQTLLMSPHQPGPSHLVSLGKRLRDFNTSDCMYKLRQVDLQMKKLKKNIGPPSHSRVRLGPWLPEEEESFIEHTLKLGIGNWAQIKEAMKTVRSSQQLKDKWRNVKPREIKDMAKRLNIKYP